jgi:hypothetical protein
MAINLFSCNYARDLIYMISLGMNNTLNHLCYLCLHYNKQNNKQKLYIQIKDKNNEFRGLDINIIHLVK